MAKERNNMGLDIMTVHQDLQTHKLEDAVFHEKVKVMESVMLDVRNDQKVMKDNHLFHIEKDMAAVKTKVGYHDRVLWLILSLSAAGLITGLFNLLLNR